MSEKLVWVDTESGGLTPGRHALLQVAMIVEIDGKIVGEHDWRMCPPLGREVTDEALAVNGMTRQGLLDLPRPNEVKGEIDFFLSHFVDKYDRSDKLTIAGYNVAAFDIPFLRDYWELCDDKYFGSWFTNYPLDVMQACCILRHYRLLHMDRLGNLKLATVCEDFDVRLDTAHDALADIRATRELWGKIVDNSRALLKEGVIEGTPAAAPGTPARDGRG
jgi:DNA polymerase III subunit epsilon